MAITRIKSGDRMSQAVVHNGIVSTAGQVAQNARGASAADQTKDILKAIDELLDAAGTDKSSLLTAAMWLANIGDFEETNAVWVAWVSAGNAPTRAFVELKVASPNFTVEIAVRAAV